MNETSVEEIRRVIGQKRREMEEAKALTSQQPIRPLASSLLQWVNLKPEDVPQPDPWVCPQCEKPQRIHWMLGGYWDPEADKTGHDVCKVCLAANEELDRLHRRRSVLIGKWSMETYAHMRLKNYRPVTESQQLALDSAQGLAEHWKGDLEGSIWLWGRQYGLGKTHLLYSLLWEALNQHKTIAVYDEPGLLKDIRDTYSDSDSKRKQKDILDEAMQVDVFGYDDLGRGYVKSVSTDWYQDILYQILNERYNSKLPFLLTSNDPPETVRKRIGGPQYSRLVGMCPKPIEIQGMDYRRKGG